MEGDINLDQLAFSKFAVGQPNRHAGEALSRVESIEVAQHEGRDKLRHFITHAVLAREG